MKILFFILLSFISLFTRGQETKENFDGHTWVAPYHLAVPKGWTIERFLIPISFAAQIPYKGIEDIRFTPGWGKADSEEYWTYAFLWYLDGSPKMDADIIAKNLTYYYTGLAKSNTDTTKIAAKDIPPVLAKFKKTVTKKGDLASYVGTIKMMDYMQRKPITLYSRVRIRTCNKEGKTIFFHELSPKPLTHKNWLAFDKLWGGFVCAVKKDPK